MIAGIDEAGRGALVGPLVIAIFLIENEEAVEGLKDSKQLSPRQRSHIYQKLKQVGKFEVVKIAPSEIDERNLNTIEVEAMKSLIEKHKPTTAYVDSFLKDPKPLEIEGINVIAEHKADERYGVVAAASIIAKVVRDAEVKKLHKKFGFFGSGYPSDPITVKFVKEHLKELENAGVVRRKWKTYKEMKKPKQSSIDNFLG
ncbi:MAG: ribonuclease HII [Methanobacteriota archaeon]|nr:MAG: ribonuclease HII [Euryarchaeota archaeon]